MMPDAGPSDSGFVRVASFSDLSKKKKICVKVQDRIIALFLVNDSVYALDLFCYHTGGPLVNGDIEDVDGRMCVICPWHRHQITLAEGESLYVAIDPHHPGRRQRKSKGVKQRTHEVRVFTDDIYVRLSTNNQGQIDSDNYFTDSYKVFRENYAVPDYSVNKLSVPLHSRRSGNELKKHYN